MLRSELKRAARLPLSFWILIALVAAANWVWLWADHKPFAWDESIHYLGAVGYYETLRHPGSDLFKKILYQSDFYPPWQELLAGAAFLCVPPSPKTAAFINVAYISGIIFLILLLGKRMFDRQAGVLAGYVFAASAMVVMQSKYFMLDIPLTFFVCLGVYVFVRSDSFARRPWALAYGLVFGLALLTKWSAAIFLALPPFLSGLRASWRREAAAADIWKNVFLACGLTALVAGPWYAVHGLQFLRHAPAYVYQRGVLENDPPLLSPASWSFYARALFTQMSWPLAILAVLGTGLFLLSPRTWWPAGLWLGLPYLCLTLIRNKDMRYTLPLLPLVSLLAVGWTSKLAEPGRKFWQGLMLAGLAGQLLYVHVGEYAGPVHRWLNAKLLGVPVISSQAPDPRPWPLAQILKDVEKSASSGQEPICLRVVPDHASFNRVAFLVARSQLAAKRILITGNTDWPAFTDFAVTKTGELGLPFAVERPQAVTRELTQGGSGPQAVFRLIKRYPLPDSSEALLYMRVPVRQPSSAAKILDALHLRITNLINRYVRGSRELTLAITPLSPGLTQEGRFKSVRIRMTSGVIGDFAHNPLGVPVHNLDLELVGLDLDLAAALEDRILPYRLAAIRVNHLEINAGDVNRALGQSQKDLQNLRVDFKPGILACEWLGRPVAGLEAGLNVAPDGCSDNLHFDLKRIRVAGVSMPGWLFQPWLEDFNPLLKLAGFPGRVQLGNIVLENGTLRLGRD